ncbi:MAG: methylase [Myxococcales bacterium]|nr:methylase [Myxococcales bacterium]
METAALSDRRALGQWFTAAPVAELAIAALRPLARGARVIDPTCGDGAFLAAAAAAGVRSLTGVEIDRVAADRARERVPGATITDGDALATELLAQLGTFDLVIGNPPWVRAGRVDPAIKRARAMLLAADWPELDRDLIEAIARHADVAATCLLRALRLVRPGGSLALVMSTALLDADGAAALWTAVERIARVHALITAPKERWFAEAAVNPMLVIAERHGGTTRRSGSPRLLRLTSPTQIAAGSVGLDGIAHHAEDRASDAHRAAATPDHPSAAWGPALRAPAAWFAWRAAAGDAVVPLRELVDVRRGLTTGANHVFYLRRDVAKAHRLERRFLAPVVRSPFNGSPASIAIAPDESPLVAIALPADLELAKVPRIAAWLADHEAEALATSASRRDPWWSLPVHPARLFLAKAYGPRFVQRFADVPMLADQRVYALHPREGVDLVALAAVLNALPTALALESLGRGSMGYGAVEWTVHDALELPVLDVRRADGPTIARLHAALAGFARRPIEHVRLEASRPDRAELDRAAMSLAPGAELAPAMWDALLGSVALRDRYLLPAV